MRQHNINSGTNGIDAQRLITPLTAVDALHMDIQRVTADTQPPPTQHSATIFAVFDQDVNQGSFLGLVTANTISSSPGMSFRDLLPSSLTPVRTDTTIDLILQRMNAEGVPAIPILDSHDHFAGAVSRHSLLIAFHAQERTYLDQMLLLRATLTDSQKKLLECSARIEQWHNASSRLLKILPMYRMPDELLQNAIEVLTQMLDASYGAIGILAKDGTLEQFIHTGINPDEVRRIGHLPRGDGLLGVVIHEDHILNISEINTDARSAGFPPHHPKMTTLLASPISYHGRIYGRIYLCDKHNHHAFGANDERLVTSFANLLALMLAHMDLLNDRELTAAALVESDTRFRTITEYGVGGVFILQDNTFDYINAAFAKLFDYRTDEITHKMNLLDLVHPDDRDLTAEQIRRCLAGEAKMPPYRFRGVCKDDSRVDCEVHCGLTQCRGRPAIIGTLLDRTAIAMAEQRMRMLSSAVEQTADTVLITDRDGTIEYVNPAFEVTTGFSRDEAIGNNPRMLKSGMQNDEFYHSLWETVTRGEPFTDILINKKKDGTLFYAEETITPLKDPTGQITHLIATGKDVTERMQTQQRLHYLAYHDLLTGLPNRSLLQERVCHAIAQEQRTDKGITVMLMDLDRFKHINDSLGHNTGDQVLKAVAERLRSSLRQSDTIARLGGDEFTILLEGTSQPDDAIPVAKQLFESLSSPLLVGDHEVFITASLGITVYPQDGDTFDILLRNADSAMYRAKEAGGNTFEFFTRDMTNHAMMHMENESNLRHALERQEFLLHFQPRVNPSTGQLIGVEALLRWQRPDGNIIPPKDFIPLLEETGLIIPVGEWVLSTACTTIRKLSTVNGPLRIAVNLSAHQFRDKNLVEMIKNTLKATDLDPHLLELEITEGLLLEDNDTLNAMLADLHTTGVRIAVDDFGTGYCSMSYLRRLPIDTLKIDQSFVRDVTSDPDDAAIVTAIIAMAQSLRLNITAEGVETEEQLAFFRDHGCHEIQGYLFARPMPETALEEWIQSRDR